MKKIASVEAFIDLLSFERFEGIHKNEFNWDNILHKTNKQSVYYNSHFIKFRLECLRGNGIECLDLSLGIKLSNEIVAIIPLFYFKNGKEFQLSFVENCIFTVIY